MISIAGDESLSTHAFPAFVASPLTGEPAKLVKKMPTAPIIEAYRVRYGYAAAPDLRGRSEIGLYQDPAGFRFWYPTDLDGPEAMYRAISEADLQKAEGEKIYQEGKWEHAQALRHIRTGDRVLDVGCGAGAFLYQAGRAGAHVTGLEFNKVAGARAAARGIEIRGELIGAHAEQRPEHYDVVTSFQVLEHVADPKGFMQGSVNALKPGGILIVGVPNCDSFMQHDDNNLLNLPPHHVGWWNRKSLEALTTLLPIEVMSFEVASLNDEEHILGWYNSALRERYVPRGKLARSLYYRLGIAKQVERFVSEHAHTIAGHTMMAVYRKKA